MYKSWKEFKPVWTAALRSGTYKQGDGQLVDSRDRFCCLGVAANLLIQSGCKLQWFEDPDSGDWEFGKPNGSSSGEVLTLVEGLPRWLRRKLEWYPPNVGKPVEHHLAEMNDKGTRFKEIANWIDKNL
jgi:hypothetical protein